MEDSQECIICRINNPSSRWVNFQQGDTPCLKATLEITFTVVKIITTIIDNSSHSLAITCTREAVVRWVACEQVVAIKVHKMEHNTTMEWIIFTKISKTIWLQITFKKMTPMESEMMGSIATNYKITWCRNHQACLRALMTCRTPSIPCRWVATYLIRKAI